MAEVRQFRESVVRQEVARDHDFTRSDVHASDGAAEYCAYNQTAQRFISNRVEVADDPNDTLEDRFSKLTPGSGIAVWIVPIRALHPTSFRFPVDLLYLAENCLVVEAVHSFPIGRVSSSIPMAASILALPAHAIVSSGIGTGDQLLLCSPEDMERQFLQADAPAPEIAVMPKLIHNYSLGFEPDQDTVVETIPLFRIGTSGSSDCTSGANVGVEPLKPIEVELARAPAPWSKDQQKVAAKKWWQKLLYGEPADPRKAERAALPGLIAYFFTGGAPAAHPVRDISTSGFFVLTSERWYRGTVVRITLTDEREPTAERSITLHAKVVRWTEDGVALQFVLHEKNERLRGTVSTLDHLSGGSSVTQVEEFIGRLKCGA